MKAAWIVAAAVILNVAAWASEYPGFAKVENFDAINGGNIANLTGAAKYTANQPDSITFVDSLYYSRNPGVDNYGSRISGVLIPQENAEYVFFVAADDSTSFYLSTDSTPANLKLIAADQGWQNSRTWTGVGGASSGAGTTNAVFRRGFNPGPDVLTTNGFEWVGPFENRSDQFLNSPRANLATAAQRWPTTNASGNAVINLVANQQYYFELLFKEGSGGENAGVAWKKAGDPDPANNDPEIPGTFLSVTWTNALTFRTQPASQTVQEGQIVNFAADVLGVPGDSDPTTFTYQWFVNNVAISDGTGNAATYTIPSAALADNGKKYKLTVTTTVLGLTATTAEATLNVIVDTQAPRISRIRTSDTFASAKITYSEGVRNEAVDPANYSFTGGLTVTDANFDIVVDDPLNPEDPKNPINPLNRVAVILFTSTQTEGATYTLTVNNVKDQIGNNLTPNTTTMYANVFQAGVLNYKRWEGGNNIANLVADPLRFADPTVVDVRTVAETGGQAATYVAGNYVDRVDGFFIPTVTTNYVFYICADNDGYAYLSTDSNPTNRKLIAADVGWQNTREWTGPGGDTAKRRGDGVGGGPFENRSDQILTSQRAINGTGLLAGLLPAADGTDPEPWPTVDGSGNAVISLTNGVRYAIQLWHVEGDSGRAEVTFKYATEADPANGTGSRITSGLIGAFVDPTSLLPVITTQPTNVNFTAGGTINFSVAATSSLPITYQWFKDGVAISGETNSTLTINNATADALGAYYVAVSNENGPVNSNQVLALTPVTAPGLTFQEDGTGMTVIETEHYFAATTAPDGHLWVPLKSRAGYSGAGYMSVLPDSAINLGNGAGFITNGARLDFRIAFVATGIHYIWLRGGDPTAGGAGDSVHAGIDGTNTATATQISGAPTFNTTGWNWVGNINGDTRASITVDTAGTHTVSLWMREDGFLVDKIILATDVAFTPTGTGPAESQQVGGTTPTISVVHNPAGVPVITYTGTLLSSSTVNGTYAPVAGASGGSYTVNLQGATQQFYKAQQ